MLFRKVDENPRIGTVPAQPDQIGFNYFAMDLPNREELENVKASHCLQKNDVRIQHMLRGFKTLYFLLSSFSL